MDPNDIAKCLILRYLRECSSSDGTNSTQYKSVIGSLSSIWQFEATGQLCPENVSLIGLMPDSPNAPPAMVEYLRAQAISDLSSCNFDSAIENLTDAIRIDPSKDDLLSLRASAFLKVSDFSHAEEDCRRVLQLNPSNPEVIPKLGFALWSMGRIEEARAIYKTGLLIQPNNPTLSQMLSFLGPEGRRNDGEALGILSDLGKLEGSPQFKQMEEDPEIAKLIAQLKANPADAYKMMGDPKFMRLMSFLISVLHSNHEDKVT